MRRLAIGFGALALVSSLRPPSPASVFRDWLHGMRRHDALYLRAHVGLGYGALSAGLDGVDMDGVALAFSAEVGGMVGSEVGLHLALWTSTLASPAADNFFGGTVEGDGSCTLIGVGPGVILYVGDTDLWVSANAGAVLGDVDSPVVRDDFGAHASRADGTVGFGVQSAVGKSFWIGADSQLGIAMTMGFAAVPLEVGGATYLGVGLSGHVTFD